jgi:hypothetical protein
VREAAGTRNTGGEREEEREKAELRNLKGFCMEE